MAIWPFDWDNGRTSLHSAGGMLGRTELHVGEGRWASPFYEAPWLQRADRIESTLIANMRGDYACIALGRPYAPDDGLPERWAAFCRPATDVDVPLAESEWLPHGYGVHNEWHLVTRDASQVVIAIDYPADSPVSRLTRTISPGPGRLGLSVALKIEVRRACKRPVGLHPNFALRGPVGSLQIDPGTFAFGLTHPVGEVGVSRVEPDAEFDSLSAVPLKGGGRLDLSRLPLALETEEFLQLCGLDGALRLTDQHCGVEWTLEWDSDQLPSCWLWISNRGRKHAPWNGENVCVGTILANAPMNLGPHIAAANNPIAARGIATALSLVPEQPTILAYRLVGRALEH